MVCLHARSHIRPHLSNATGRKLCSVQFPDDLFRRFYNSLAFGVAVPVLPLGRISEAGLRARTHKSCKRRSLNVLFAPKTTELLRRRKITRKPKATYAPQ